MTMRTGQLWECLNAACGCEILVVAKSGVKSRIEPRCCCGSMMQKSYAQQIPGARSGHHRGNLPGRLEASRADGPANATLSKTSQRLFFPK
jgi:hypothetical protein